MIDPVEGVPPFGVKGFFDDRTISVRPLSAFHWQQPHANGGQDLSTDGRKCVPASLEQDMRAALPPFECRLRGFRGGTGSRLASGEADQVQDEWYHILDHEAQDGVDRQQREEPRANE